MAIFLRTSFANTAQYLNPTARFKPGDAINIKRRHSSNTQAVLLGIHRPLYDHVNHREHYLGKQTDVSLNLDRGDNIEPLATNEVYEIISEGQPVRCDMGKDGIADGIVYQKPTARDQKHIFVEIDRVHRTCKTTDLLGATDLFNAQNVWVARFPASCIMAFSVQDTPPRKIQKTNPEQTTPSAPAGCPLYPTPEARAA